LIVRNVEGTKVEALELFTFHGLSPSSTQLRNVLIMVDLHQPGYSWHPARRTSFASRTEISRFSRTLLRHFRITKSDASGARSRAMRFLGCTEALLMLLRATERSTDRPALLCGNAAYCSLVCERPESCYGRAVFISDDLAADGSPFSYAPDGERVILAPVRLRRQSHPLESIDKHEYCAYACRSKHFLFRPLVSGQWTALCSRWTSKQYLLFGATQCLRV
jgi:hypothetical protein